MVEETREGGKTTDLSSLPCQCLYWDLNFGFSSDKQVSQPLCYTEPSFIKAFETNGFTSHINIGRDMI